MTTRSTLVPRETEDVARFIETFKDEHGLAPIGGGETVAGAPPAAPAAPAAPVTHYDVPPAAPAVAPPGEPAAPAVEQPPDWAQSLIDRVDLMAPPAVPDPVAIELGLAQAPLAPPQSPQQIPASPGQPQPAQGTPFPGQQDPQAQQLAEVESWVNGLIEQRVAAAVTPRLDAMRQQQRQEEIAGLRQEFPELNDPAQQGEILGRARHWSTLMSGNEELAREPAFLEMVLLSGRQLAANATALAQQPPTGAPVLPGAQPGVPIEAPGAAAPGAPIDPSQSVARQIRDAGAGNGLAGSIFA